MYVTTFYSFKGGVGRTLALVNVAFSLALSGKKVLLIDFDLEAPGLDTFPAFQGSASQQGLVDYIHDYLNTNVSPDVRNYIFECKKNHLVTGSVYLIPAGRQDESYSRKLAAIDWNYLYEKKDGFLLFEDLKAQIHQSISPDYILIDSRTGHSDVAGICTRQLPNSVVFLFFPNEQNLRGLAEISNQIDFENRDRSIDRKISKHFVSSNVPDLDDEDGILARKLELFSRELGFSELDCTIHRYNSLALLDQEIFSLERQKTKLACEYSALAKKIVDKNIEDPDAAIDYLKSITGEKTRMKGFSSEVINRVILIREIHNSHPIILRQIADIMERTGDIQDAFSLVSKSISLGDDREGNVLKHLQLAIQLDKNEEILSDISILLAREDIAFSALSFVVRVLISSFRDKIDLFFESTVFNRADVAALISIFALLFGDSIEKVEIAEYGLAKLLNRPDLTESEKEAIYSSLLLACIAEQKYSQAVSLSEKVNDGSIRYFFNLAMAKWAIDKSPDKKLFFEVIKLSSKIDISQINPNMKQCLSLAYWVNGNLENAIELAELARQQVLDTKQVAFSCWLYLLRSPAEFSSDIAEMLKMYRSGQVTPAFMKNQFRLI